MDDGYHDEVNYGTQSEPSLFGPYNILSMDEQSNVYGSDKIRYQKSTHIHSLCFVYKISFFKKYICICTFIGSQLSEIDNFIKPQKEI